MLRLRTVWTGIAGSPFLTTTFHAGGVADADAAADALEAYWTACEPVITSTVDWEIQAVVDEVEASSGNVLGRTGVTARSGSGGVTGTAVLALGTCGLVNLHSGEFVDGREKRGKLYIPGPNEQHMNDGTPTSTYRDTTAGAALEALIDPSGFGYLGIYSRLHGVFDDVSVGSASAYFARLRTRQR